MRNEIIKSIGKPEGQQLILVTPDYLDRLMIGIRQEMRDGIVELKTHMVENLLTRKEAAKFLRIGVTALDNRLKRGQIPSRLVHKNGGTSYFLASELLELIKKS